MALGILIDWSICLSMANMHIAFLFFSEFLANDTELS